MSQEKTGSKKIATKKFQHTALPKKSNFIKTTNKKNECLDEIDFDEDEFQGGFVVQKQLRKPETCSVPNKLYFGLLIFQELKENYWMKRRCLEF